MSEERVGARQRRAHDVWPSLCWLEVVWFARVPPSAIRAASISVSLLIIIKKTVRLGF